MLSGHVDGIVNKRGSGETHTHKYTAMYFMYIERREIHTCIAWIITNRFRIVQAPSLAEVLPVKSLPSHETVSNPLLTCSCTVIPPLDNSDHNGLLTRLLWRSSSSHNCPNHSKGHTVWLYRHAEQVNSWRVLTGNPY